MSKDEQLHIIIQSLHDEIKRSYEENSQLRVDIDYQTKQQNVLNNDISYLRQKIAAVQMENSNYSNAQARLEIQLYNQEQDLFSLKKENNKLSKAKREAEKRLGTELTAFEEEKIEWFSREADLYDQMRALSTAEPRTPKTPQRRSITPLSPHGLGDIEEKKEDFTKNVPKLLHPSYAIGAKAAQSTIKVQKKLIADITIELDKHKTALQEYKTSLQSQSLKMEHLECEVANVKHLNSSLMEDNESYRILLHEKTMNGEFMMNPIMQVHEDSSNTASNSLNLADELNMASDWNQKDQEKTIHKLNDEIKTLQDTNRALQLYMNKILMKIINNKQLEDVLNIDQPNMDEPVRPQLPTMSFSTNPHNDVKGRPRRRTISYWGSKANKNTTPCSADNMDKRRHSSIISSNPQPEKFISTTPSSSWTKTLRRLSAGWAVSIKEPETASNDSAVFSSEEESSITSRNSDSSSPCRNTELGTLAEE